MFLSLSQNKQKSDTTQENIPFPAPQNPTFTFIDLFAGIGGFRIALQNLGGKCVFSSEIDKYAQQTYEANFGEKPFGDITLEETKSHIPKTFDILCGGFPCQAFSIAGNRKGFEDTRGTLFFEIAEIARRHTPKVIFLENVKNLLTHDEWNTFRVIQETLQDLGYNVKYKILNASHFWLPQNRERVYIVALRKNIKANFSFPLPTHIPISLEEILEKIPNISPIHRDDVKIYKEISNEYTLFDMLHTPNKPLQIGKVNKGGQWERIYHPKGHAITLSAYGWWVGAKTGLYYINHQIRRLTPRECARAQGFPDIFLLNPSQSQCYKQFGNSVALVLIQTIGKNIISQLV